MTKPFLLRRRNAELVFTYFRLAAARAANTNRYLLAVDPTYTTRNRVRHLPWYALVYFNSLLLAYLTAYRVAHRLGALLGNHAAHFVAASLGLRNHVAHLVATRTSALLANHAAHLVAAGLGLWNHVAHFEANRAGARLTNILRAADFLRRAGRYANSLAASAIRRAARQRAARTGAVDTAALRGVVAKRTWLANRLCVSLAWNRVALVHPLASTDLDGLGVRHSDANVVGLFTSLGAPNWLVDRVSPSLGFPNWAAYGVRNFAGASFPDGLVHRVGALLGFPNWAIHGVAALLGFPNRLAYGVANIPSSGFPDRTVYGVGALLGFPNRTLYGVTNVTRLGFPNRAVHGVAACLGFPNRLAYGVTNLLLTLLANVASHVDHFVFANSVVNSTVASFTLTFPLYAADRLHHGVATLLVATGRTPVVPCSAAIPRPCCRWQHNDGDRCNSLHYRLSSHW